MTNLERAAGIVILTGLIVVLDIAVFDYVSNRVSESISQLARAVAQTP